MSAHPATTESKPPSSTETVVAHDGVAPAQGEPSWTVDDARELYMVERWGDEYFGIDDEGNMTAAPRGVAGRSIAIQDVVRAAIKDEGLKTPLIIRFQDILHHRVRVLNNAFNKAVEENNFRGSYRGVFPIKVNQMREVVEEILEAGRPFHYGIEVGSKPEMCAGLAVHTDNDSLIVCNGYKDDAFIRTALLGTKLGKKVIMIAEKLSEVRAIVRIAKEMSVMPEIGVRVRLVTRGAGKWAESGGENAKFGLSTAEILEAASVLREAGMESAFKLVHFHIGSQVPDILIIKRAVREAARYYAKLRRAGYPIEYLDVGGGLAVDYDGTRSNSHASMNYSVEEYARDVVWNIADICDEEKVPHPHIISESGRAIVSHHAVLVVEAFGTIDRASEAQVDGKISHKLITNVREIAANLGTSNLAESWHDLLQIKEQSQKMFELGLLELDAKGCFETLFWQTTARIRDLVATLEEGEVPDELADIQHELASQHICNFSVFQSLLDHWAFGALFPVAPIHRLNERPTLETSLVDITCDSDGKVAKFIDRDLHEKSSIMLHQLETIDKGPYHIGVFLIGAYQDIMGDIHNLLGRVNEVHVFLDDEEDCGYYLEETIEGNTIAEVLRMTQYEPHDLAAKMKAQVDAGIKQGRLKPTEGMRLLAEYERGLKDQTYLSL